MNTIQAVRGMNDILPSEVNYWQDLELIIRKLTSAYAYQEIRLPIIEDTALFLRSVGEVSDIVSKETYTFKDRNEDSLTLRPEGTAGCVRAVIQHHLLQEQAVQRLWYRGPMFRHERPQKGRYRQFHQWGIETFGLTDVNASLELLLICHRFWKELGLSQEISLEINSLGSLSARNLYREKLVAYFTEHQTQLDEDSKVRLHKNPLRILDSKNPAMAELIAGAPKISDCLDPDSKQELDQICSALDRFGIAYTLNPYLVRGLDYYTGLVFEWVTTSLGAQATVCAGGRYDRLVEELGGMSSPAIGFAMGLERLVLLMQEKAPLPQKSPDVYLISVGEAAMQHSMLIAEKLRDSLSTLSVLVHCGEASFKSQFKKADKSGAKLALILGETEVQQKRITVKFLREEKEQLSLSFEEMVELLLVTVSK